jgi:hypothetical protein
MPTTSFLFSVILSLATPPSPAPDERPLVEKYLHAGQYAEGEKALTAILKDTPADDRARFGLGTLQFVRAVERLGQSLHRYGLHSRFGTWLPVPFLRFPVPDNPRPERLTFAESRQIIQQFLDDLAAAERTLAAVRDDHVRLTLRVAAIALDFDRDGKPDDRLGGVVSRYMGGRGVPLTGDLDIAFDRGDVAWLRGYCHLLMALCEIVLAHDGEELFHSTAHIFFKNVESRYPFLAQRADAGQFGNNTDIVDLIATLHLVRLPVMETERMKVALGHLEQMLALSRESWRFIQQETDDDREWVPNANQHSVLGIPVTKEMIASWLDFIDEAESLLAGKRLVPFWRGNDGAGVNLRRVFTEPRPFDLVLWVQGTAAAPYLEHGPLTRADVWSRLTRVFGGQFIGFAVWFN